MEPSGIFSFDAGRSRRIMFEVSIFAGVIFLVNRTLAPILRQRTGISSLSFWFCYLVCFRERVRSLVNSRAASNEAAHAFHDQWIYRLSTSLDPNRCPSRPSRPNPSLNPGTSRRFRVAAAQVCVRGDIVDTPGIV